MTELFQHLDSPSTLRQLVAAGADVTVANADGENALHLIAAKRKPVLESAEILLAAGTSINNLDNQLRTPLFRAVYDGESSETVSWLLDHGACVDVPGTTYTPLQAASYWCQTKIMLLLLRAGANPNVSTSQAPVPPLVQVMGSQRFLLESATMLLDHGADPSFAGYGGKTPLARAAMYADSEYDPANTYSEKIDVLFLLFEVADRRHTAFSRQVIDDAFSHCSRRYIHDVFALFLEKGANVNLKLGAHSYKEYTRPLILACETENIRPESIEFLLRQGADPALTDGGGAGPLHAAARNAAIATIKLLLDSGALIDQRDSGGKTALHVACDKYKFLVPTQADLDLRAGLFMSRPVDLAAMSERDRTIYRVAIETNERRETQRRRHLQFIETLVGEGASLTAQDDTGATAMHFACAAGDLELVMLITRTRAGRYILVDKLRRTPLHWAIEYGATDIVGAMTTDAGTDSVLDYKKTRRLPARMIIKARLLLGRFGQSAKDSATPSPTLCYGALSRHVLLHVSDAQGRQGLHTAAAAGKEDVISVLLERSDLQLENVDRDGRTAMRLAEEGRHLGCSTVIRAALRKQKHAREHSLRMERLWNYLMSASLVIVVVIAVLLALWL